MRSSSEIAAEINALKAQIASGLPYGNSEAHNAAVFDHVYSGDRSGVDAFQRAIEQAIQNKMQRELTEREGEANRQNALKIAEIGKAEAVAERKQKADELKALKLAQARPEYMKIQKAMLDAVDAGKFDEAAIYQEQLNALNAEHGIGVSKNVETLKQGWKDAREKASQKRLNVANFLADLPTTFDTEEDKKSVYALINNNPDMATDEKAKEIERIRNIKAGDTKIDEAVQGAKASTTGKGYEEAVEERKATIKAAKAAYQFQKKYPNRQLTKSQRDAMAKADAKGWKYKD